MRRRTARFETSRLGRVTINDLLRVAGEHSWLLLAYFALPPLLTLATGRTHNTRRDGARNPPAIIYCVLIYVVSVPGALAAVLTGYGLFFLRADLRSVPILIYFLPVVSELQRSPPGTIFVQLLKQRLHNGFPDLGIPPLDPPIPW